MMNFNPFFSFGSTISLLNLISSCRILARVKKQKKPKGLSQQPGSASISGGEPDYGETVWLQRGDLL
jgi:hypothetical protein